MIFKTRKIERRNFFVASSSLSVIYWSMLAIIYNIVFRLVQAIGSAPPLNAAKDTPCLCLAARCFPAELET
jgi:hypothetical protein